MRELHQKKVKLEVPFFLRIGDTKGEGMYSIGYVEADYALHYCL